MFVFSCLLVLTVLTSVNSNCYWGSHPDTYPRNISTYAVYEKVIPNYAIQQDFESGCEPVTIFFIGRNNIKYPSSDVIEKMYDELPMLQDAILRANGALCMADKQALSEWTMGFDDKHADQFTEPGYISAKQLGDRFKYRFPSLFHSTGDDSDIIFAHVYSNETYNSAVAFADGAFNNTALVTDGFDISNLDSRLLSFGRVCDAQSDRDDVKEELEDFIEEQVVQDMITRMSSRLGLSDDVLTFKRIDLMYKVCALESSLYARSPWCSMFTWEDSSIMEFKEDMVTHQLYGPSEGGISEDQTCMLMKDFVDKVDNPYSTSSMPRGVFYFASADAILPFISKLGLFPEDEELESDSLSDTEENVAFRKWRMSRINPLGSNVAIVLYRCGETLSLKVLLNEQEQIIPPCQSSLCPIHTLLGDIENFAEDCDFDDICDGAISQTLSRGSLVLTTCLVLAALLSMVR